MTNKLIHATSVLCHLLEKSDPIINGSDLLAGEFAESGQELVRERLLTQALPLSYVTCPDCGIELAKYLRRTKNDRILLYCDECGEIDAQHTLTHTYKVSLPTVVDRLAISLELSKSNRKIIDQDTSWRLGIQEIKRGKSLTWYFARHLNDHSVARRLLDQIRGDSAALSSMIITSTELPLPPGSPLTDFTLQNLSLICRLSQNRFLFFNKKVEISLPVPEEKKPITSLRYVRDKSKAYVDGVEYKLQPMQKKILIGFIEAHSHRLELNKIKELCGSQAADFRLARKFSRIEEVQKAFIKFVRIDDIYELIIHPEDQDWL